MVMLHLFKEAGFTIGVAHCNFQLRGKESDLDESFVQQVAKDLNLAVFVNRFDTELYAWEQGLSIQMAARDLRYAWFQDLIKLNSYNLLATGHHFDDSMETILLNLTKGSATEGLAGIPVKKENIIRPLLFVTRAQVEKYAREKGIAWREDESNLTDDYQRNFIRHQVLPKLKELNPSLDDTWEHGIEKIKGDLELMHIAFDNWRIQFVSEMMDRIVIQKKAFDLFSAGHSVLWRFIKGYGFNFEQAQEIIHALKAQSGKRFLSPTHVLVVDRETLIITPQPEEWNAVKIEKQDHEADLGPWKLFFSPGTKDVFNNSKMEAALDADQLAFPLIWRKWKNGDAFQPLGMSHRKKLSDFFIDNKLSVADKNAITVLESNGRIIYVVGWRIDDRFKITKDTKNVLSIRVKHVFQEA